MLGNFVTFIAQLLGASESGTRLLLSLFSSYPLAMLYCSPLLYNQPAAVKHVYFTLTGILQCYFNFGVEVYRSLFNITVMYVLFKFAGGTKFCVAFAFIFNTAYILIGYYYEVVSGKEYNISWTMPHCVLTLRLTAVAFDLYDGCKRPVPPEAKDSALDRCPGLLELLGQCYFFGGFLVGPQYNMRRYLNFVHGEYSDPKTKGPRHTTLPALERLLLGIVYIGVYQVIFLFVSDDYILSPAFQERGLLFKCMVLLFWGRTCLNKYVGSWLIGEGSLIYCGLSYNGMDDRGQDQWDGCTNVRVRLLESGRTLRDIIRSFNCNTNLWMAKYIFKRLRFLGNKKVSQLLTLLYLALWHGLASGYYICFFLEFVYTMCEQQMAETIERVGPLRRLAGVGWLRPVGYVGQKLFTSFLLSQALVSFSLLQWNKWIVVYKSLDYIGFIGPVAIILVCSVVLRLWPRKAMHNGVASSSQTVSQAKERSD